MLDELRRLEEALDKNQVAFRQPRIPMLLWKPWCQDLPVCIRFGFKLVFADTTLR